VPDDASFCPKCGSEINTAGPEDFGRDFGRHIDRHMRREMRRNMRWQWFTSPAYLLVESISAGIILILLGILLYLAATNATPLVTWANFWAYFLVGIGAFLILRFFLFILLAPQAGYFRYGGLVWGIILIAVGAAWLSATVFSLGMPLWPFIIVLGGVLVIVVGVARYFFAGQRVKKE
jgi:hypothetical protein